MLFSQLLSSNNHETVLIRRNYLFIVFQVALFQNLSDWHVFRVHLNNILYLRFLSLSIFLNLFGLNFFLKVNLIETCDKFRFVLNIWIDAFCLICILNIYIFNRFYVFIFLRRKRILIYLFFQQTIFFLKFFIICAR